MDLLEELLIRGSKLEQDGNQHATSFRYTIWHSIAVNEGTSMLTFAFRPSTSTFALDACISHNSHDSGYHPVPSTGKAFESTSSVRMRIARPDFIEQNVRGGDSIDRVE